MDTESPFTTSVGSPPAAVAGSCGPGPHTCVADTLGPPASGAQTAEYVDVLTHRVPAGQHSCPPQHTASAPSGQHPKLEPEKSTGQHVWAAPHPVGTPAGHDGPDAAAATSAAAETSSAQAAVAGPRGGVILSPVKFTFRTSPFETRRAQTRPALVRRFCSERWGARCARGVW